jgi:hypothetical protein
MDDSLRMCGVESVGDLNAQIEHGLDLEGFASDQMAQGVSFQQFHGDEGSPVGFVNLVDRADVRVVLGGRGLWPPVGNG